ncbi:MAG TPA: PmoA family protein [Planctomycetota bacterium]|nr:PmoA family protein [Planctomycetota bacterium]
MRTLGVLVLLASLALAARPAEDRLTVTVAAFEKDRRWVVVEYDAKGKTLPGSEVTDEKGTSQPGQATPRGLAWLVPFIPAGQKLRFTLGGPGGSLPAAGLRWDEVAPGVSALKAGDREITRYHVGVSAEKYKKPFFYPLMTHGVNLLRGWPMDPQEGEPADHPHHTGHYFAFGEVNGKEYWSKLPITPKKLQKEAGPVFSRIVAENDWGEDLVENQDVRLLSLGEDVILDWTITLTAAHGPVTFAKDLKQAKEGAFVLRMAKELSFAKGDAPEMILDSKGNRGEKLAREAGAPWVDYTGTIRGKSVGVAIMNHPSSFRYPSDWHVRAYGLFAANPWILKGENTLQKGQSLTLRWRVYAHGGDAAQGKVAEVFAGYAASEVVAD